MIILEKIAPGGAGGILHVARLLGEEEVLVEDKFLVNRVGDRGGGGQRAGAAARFGDHETRSEHIKH